MTRVLTDKEKADLRDGTRDIMELIDDVQSAVIKRLAAGVSVELTKLCTDNRGTTHYGYTDDQLTTAIAAARVQALEEAAKVCETEICDCCWDDDAKAAAEHLADAISALLGKEQS